MICLYIFKIFQGKKKKLINFLSKNFYPKEGKRKTRANPKYFLKRMTHQILSKKCLAQNNLSLKKEKNKIETKKKEEKAWTSVRERLQVVGQHVSLKAWVGRDWTTSGSRARWSQNPVSRSLHMLKSSSAWMTQISKLTIKSSFSDSVVDGLDLARIRASRFTLDYLFGL